MSQGNRHPNNCACNLCQRMANASSTAKTTKDNRKAITFYLTEEEAQRLQEVAEEEGLSRSAMAARAVRFYINNA